MSRERLAPIEVKDVTPFVVSEPYGIDIAITGIQQKLAQQIPWLEKSFGKAVKRVNTTKNEAGSDEDYFFPSMFIEDGKDWLDLLMNDNFNSYTFFTVDDPTTIEDFEEGVQNIYQRPFNLIFWGNLDRIYPSKTYDYLEEIKDDIAKAIKISRYYEDPTDHRTVQGVDIVSIFDNHENIFDGFSFDRAKTQYLHFPYRGLKFTMNAYIVEGC
jgi:hypothetical protein